MKAALPRVVALVAAVGMVSPHLARAQGASSPSPFLRSVPSGPATTQAISITIGDAIGRALDRNLGLLLAEHRTVRARGARSVALSELLPEVNGQIGERRQVVNLAAFGFPLPAGTPALVGPFNIFDARVSLTQSVFDAKALNEWRAERHTLAAADFSYKSARDMVVLVAADAYLRALAAASRSESVRAQLRTAEALAAQAADLKAAGIVAGIDVLRAQLQVSTQRQRTTAAESDAQKMKLQLARVIGLPAGQPFTLVDEIPTIAKPTLTLDEAIAHALATRPDYQAALAHVRAAEADRRAARGESLPSVQINADYGEIGRTASSAERTYALSGSVVVPLFGGGRRVGHRLEADADLRSRQAEAEDIKASIDYEVRTSFLDLQSSESQLQVAMEARSLADQQLTQSRDRLAAGVANSIEVIQAQESVALASEQYITALYSFNRAKATLARDLGDAEIAARRDLGGIR